MLRLTFTAAAFALIAGAGLAQTVRMGTEGAYPPYNFINDAGEVSGFERDVGDELCKRAGLTCEWVTNDWDSIIPNLQSGNYDTIIAGMSITEERDKIIDFTQNYFPPAASAYAALSADADVTGGVIAAQVNTIQAGYVAESGATLLEFATPDETVAAVRNGEADGVGMGLRESDTALRDKFDAAIQSMKDDGTLNAAIKKWFGDDAPQF